MLPPAAQVCYPTFLPLTESQVLILASLGTYFYHCSFTISNYKENRHILMFTGCFGFPFCKPYTTNCHFSYWLAFFLVICTLYILGTNYSFISYIANVSPTLAYLYSIYWWIQVLNSNYLILVLCLLCLVLFAS